MLATAFLSAMTLRFVLLGLATGALSALVGLGVVLVYRTSGVLNFAAGALGGIGAFVCYALREDHHAPMALALGAGLLVGALSGVLTFFVIALLRGSSVLTKLVATLGLFSAAQGLMVIVWGSDIRQPKSFLPTTQVALFGKLRIGEDRLVLIALVLVLAGALRFVYARSLFGLATAAVAENRRVAAGFGWSTSRVELINFTIAGVLSALAAILLAPIITLTPAVLSVAVLPALAAALVGGFSSFSATVAAALFIGVVQSLVTLFQPDLATALDVGASSLTGLPQAVPLVIILVFTVLSGRGRLQRGEQQARLPLPGGGRVSLVPLLAGLAVGTVLLVQAESWADGLIATFGMAIIVTSVVVVSGYAGQLSLCQYALAGFGAWVAARLVSSADVPFELALVAAVAATVVAGMLVALPALRTRGVNLAVATLALALLFHSLIFSNSGMTGGFTGTVVRPPTVFGVDVDPITHPQRYGGLLLLAVLGTGLVAANLRRGRVGRRMLAVRSNERAAAALGVSIVEVKLYAFAVGAGVAAVGGVLLAFRQRNIQFAQFDVFGSILSVQYAVIGGLGWLSGAVVGAAAAPGAVVATLVSKIAGEVTDIGAWLALVAGVGVVLMLRQAPDGVAAQWSRLVGRHLERWRFPRAGARLAAPAARAARPPAILVAEQISVHFGGVVAVHDVSFAVHPGEIVGLIGPNGAGKTTLLDALTGFTTQTSGTVRLDGTDIGSWTPERRARAGMARSWQAVELFDELTVRDNLLVACDEQRRTRFVLDLVHPGGQQLTQLAEEVVDDLALRPYLDQRPSSLPQGVRRLVGIARSIVADPSILLLDEPAAGLGPNEGAELAAVVTGVARRRGLGVVIVEHDVPLLLGMCDRIVALDFGRKIADGTPAEVAADESVIRAYLGDADPHAAQVDRLAAATEVPA